MFNISEYPTADAKLARHAAEIELRKLQLEMSSLRVQLAEQYERVSNAQKRSQTAELENTELVKQVTQQKEEMDMLHQQLEEVREAREALRTRLSAESGEVEDLTQELNTVTDQLTRAKTEMAARNAQHEEQLRECAVQAEALRVQVAAANSNAAIEQARAAELVRLEKNKRAEIESCMAQLHARIAELQELNQESETQISGHVQNIKEQQKQIDELTREKAKYLVQVSELNAEIAALNSVNDSMAKQLEDVRNTVEGEIPKQAEIIQALQKQVDDFTTQLAHQKSLYSRDVTELKSQIADLSAANSELTAQVAAETQAKMDVEQSYSKACLDCIGI